MVSCPTRYLRHILSSLSTRVQSGRALCVDKLKTASSHCRVLSPNRRPVTDSSVDEAPSPSAARDVRRDSVLLTRGEFTISSNSVALERPDCWKLQRRRICTGFHHATWLQDGWRACEAPLQGQCADLYTIQVIVLAIKPSHDSAVHRAIDGCESIRLGRSLHDCFVAIPVCLCPAQQLCNQISLPQTLVTKSASPVTQRS
jgi:hypothetical protein